MFILDIKYFSNYCTFNYREMRFLSSEIYMVIGVWNFLCHRSLMLTDRHIVPLLV